MGRIPLVLLAAVCLSACATRDQRRDFAGAPQALVQDKYFLDLSKKYFENDGLNKAIEAYKATTPSKAKEIRNEVAFDLMSISDYLFDQSRDDLFLTKGATDAAAKIYNLLFTSIATISTVERVKTGFSAAATFLSGSKAISDEETYAKQTRSTIVSTMIGRRAQVKTAVLGNLTKPTSDYSISAAIANVQEYHRAGSFVEALIELERLANSESQKKVETLRTTEQAISKTQP